MAGPAQAADPNSQFDQPALGQYIETLPGSGGPTAPGVGNVDNGGGGAPLSPRARVRLRRFGGSLSAPLEQLASSRQLGAPPPPPRDRTQPAHHRGTPVANDDKSLMKALSDVTTQGDGAGSGLWLLLALLGLSAAVVALAVRNRRQAGRPAG